jgi:CelD/BcsL family acetyltransferase involved in cellulose biosynthesis
LKLAPSRVNWIGENPSNFYGCKFEQQVLEKNAPYIHLDNYVEPVRKSLRNSLKNAHNRLKDREVDFAEIRFSENQFADFEFKQLEKWHKLRWGGASIFKKSPLEYRDFYFRLSQIKSNTVNPVLHTLRIDGEIAAVHFGFYVRDNLYYWSPISNEDFKFYSPSKVLLEKIIVNAIEQKVEIFDFMNDNEPYKLDWTDTAADRYKYTFASNKLYLPRFDKYRLRQIIYLMFFSNALKNFIKTPVSSFRRFISH